MERQVTTYKRDQLILIKIGHLIPAVYTWSGRVQFSRNYRNSFEKYLRRHSCR